MKNAPQQWPADQVERRPIASLVPYVTNARTHSDAQVAQIAASMSEWGFTNPVLVDEQDGIIAGHGRILAAHSLGWLEVPVTVARGWTDAQKRAYVLADNKLALNAGWDDALLAGELGALQLGGFDLGLIGFGADELDELMAATPGPGLTDEDACPEVPVEPVTKLGDVWIMGKHRVMCGDATSATDLARLMRGGVMIKAYGMILGDDKTGDDLVALVREALACASSSCKEGSAYYVCFTWRTYSEFESALSACGLDPNSCIVWDKKSIGLGNANYRPQHEFIFYIKGKTWFGGKDQSDVWYMSRGATGDYVHPTQKPVELIERAIENSSQSGDTVLDLFGGSGSALIACDKTGRHARLMELDPKYCDVIVHRWQEFTGQQATLESTGQTFAEVSAERVPETEGV